MQKIFKFKKTFFLIFTFINLAFFKFAFAIEDQTDAFIESAGFSSDISDNTLTDTISFIIKIFLGFLGIIFIILVIWAGYNWMTAGGNEEKVSKARTTIYRAIIGLVITVSAYAITYFIFNALGSGGGWSVSGG